MQDPDTTPNRADARDLAFTVLNEINIIAQLSRTRFERVMPGGLLVPHFAVLNHMVRLGDDKPISRLAFAFEVSKGTMTNTVQRLEQRGFVEVRPDPADGRGKRVFITEAGRAMREAAIANLAPDLADLEATLGAETFATLLPHLRHLRATLDAKRDR